MEREKLQKLRESLERQREALLREGDLEVHPEKQDAPLEKPDDDAAPLSEMNQVIASNRNRERTEQLRRIDDALSRMQSNPEDFGRCEECDELIGSKRLELLPWVRLCTDCQSSVETGQTPGGRRHITDYR
jgi:DnaK suppressor protein